MTILRFALTYFLALPLCLSEMIGAAIMGNAKITEGGSTSVAAEDGGDWLVASISFGFFSIEWRKLMNGF